jgi:hypothetical protein
VLAFLAALLRFAAVAVEATANQPTDRAVRAAERIAEKHWGFRPCQGEMQRVWKPLYTDEWQSVRAQVGSDSCYVEYGTQFRWYWHELCVTTAHEWGHLLRDLGLVWFPVDDTGHVPNGALLGDLMGQYVFAWDEMALNIGCGKKPPYERRKPRRRDRTAYRG